MQVTRALLPLLLLIPPLLNGQAIRNNLGFTLNSLERNDDASSPAFPLGFRINFFGQLQDTVFVNNNGNLTFDAPLPGYRPSLIADTARVIIAPFWADVDTRGNKSSAVTYGRDVVNGRPAFGANYRNVGYYRSKDDKLNSFQVVLIDRSDLGSGNFDIEFNYETIQWDAGEVTIGYGARVGYSNGRPQIPDGNYEVENSGISRASLDSSPTGLIRRSLNSDVPGRLVFQVRNGGVASTLTVDQDSLLFITDAPANKPDIQRVNVRTNQGAVSYTVSSSYVTQTQVPWLFAAPINATTPNVINVDVSTEQLAPGGYGGNVKVQPTGANSNLAAQNINILVAVGRTVPIVVRAGVVNAASFVPGVISPGGIFSIFGANMADSTQSANVAPIPDVLNNVRVEIDGQRISLFFVSPTQINAVLPFNFLPKQDALLRVVRNNIPGTPVRVDIAPATPGVFQYNGGDGIVQNQDGSLNGVNSPESGGRAIVLYTTGLGPVANPPNPGVPASLTTLSPATRTVQVLIGNRSATVAFAGLTPGFIGLYQINAVVPAGLSPGAQQLVVIADNYPSAAVAFYVK